MAVVPDAVEMLHEQAGELLEGRQPLPTQSQEPVGEEAAGRTRADVDGALEEMLFSGGSLNVKLLGGATADSSN